MTTGFSAGVTLTVVGATASDVGQEQDLATDGVGDLLLTDSAGDVLLAIPGMLWSGGTAARTLSALAGAGASLIVADGPERIDAEGWIEIVTETGSPIVTEGT
jgi:hypothetical protein